MLRIDFTKKHLQARNFCGGRSLTGHTLSNPLEHMTENSKKAPVPSGQPGAASFHPGVSAQLREYYQSVQEEGIPERFLELLERLDMAEKQAGESNLVKDGAR
jgi:hypothetical protein